MRAWIIQTGELLPIDGENQRLGRSGMLAEILRDRGHEVTWWASTFRHSDHSFRFDRDTIVDWNGIRLLLVHSPGYGRNVSLRRLRDHKVLGREMRRIASDLPRPDVIHSGYPPLEPCETMVDYGRLHKVPVVVDPRDMWPEAFEDVLPRLLKPFAKPAFGAFESRARKMFRSATAIHGHTPGFMDYGLKKAGRAAGPFDSWFPFGYPSRPTDEPALNEADRFWDLLGLASDDDCLTICFFGNLNSERKELDHRTPALAVRLMNERSVKARIIFCGAGRVAERLSREFADIPGAVLTPGFMNAARIWALMKRSHFGLLPYAPSRDFLLSIPNKAIEYLAGGLPVLTSLTGGYLSEKLSEAGCLLGYPFGDAESLALSLELIASNRRTMERMSAAAAALFESQFRAETVYSRLADLLEKLACAELGAGLNKNH